jgi:hypothetical protein
MRDDLTRRQTDPAQLEKFVRIIQAVPSLMRVLEGARRLNLQSGFNRVAPLGSAKEEDGGNVAVWARSMIDDLSAIGIDEMKRSGFEPAVIVETSLNNF